MDPRDGTTLRARVERGWTVTAVVVPMLIGIAWAALAITPAEFDIARGCFLLSSVMVAVVSTWSVVGIAWRLWARLLLAVLICVAIAIIALATLTWVTRREAKMTAASAPESPPPTANDVATALRAQSQPSASEKTARKALRKSLTGLLLRGEKLRQALSEELNSPEHRGLGGQLAAVSKWDRELVAYVRATIGEESAAEIRAKTPSGTYPSGPYYPEAQAAWDTLHSNMAEIRKLLHDNPEL